MLKQRYSSQYQLGVMLSESERKQLEYVIEKLGVRRSDFVRLAIRYFYDELEEKEER